MRTYRLVASLVAAAAIATALAAPAQAVSLTMPGCGDAVQVSTFHQGNGDFLENLAFDGEGGLWIANSSANRIDRYAPDGRVTATVPGIRAAASIRKRGDSLYVNYGDGVPDHLLPFNNAGVVRVDLATLAVSPYADGLHVANGSAFDSAGNLYVSNSGGLTIARVRPGGQVEPAWVTLPSTPNGVTVIGDTLYATLTLDLRSPVVAVPLADPGAWRILTELASPLFKGLDDVYAGPDEQLYVAGNLVGELFRVDPATGSACLLAAGLPAGITSQVTNGITSVSMAHDFGPYAGDLFLTAGNGTITRLSTRH
ncbi:hypothetical protein F0L68_00920 [Solihabitans fulvus]|uniref:SMP-30/Gluconolactonase/LRE-like region domain-containing protein n=1 Tax=Solihabitans fulvus TaxID=1892852 RepID=A0A5B2XVE6_9PSEU|nr:hypothetical protein [Solihabitans fulvus]KAA2267125.1 hypothetical protein F0L68_00920 [Solihabitans fulvus]